MKQRNQFHLIKKIIQSWKLQRNPSVFLTKAEFHSSNKFVKKKIIKMQNLEKFMLRI